MADCWKSRGPLGRSLRRWRSIEVTKVRSVGEVALLVDLRAEITLMQDGKATPILLVQTCFAGPYGARPIVFDAARESLSFELRGVGECTQVSLLLVDRRLRILLALAN